MLKRINQDSWYKMLALERPNYYIYHLWTIPGEVKYFFVIPVICLVCALIKYLTGLLSIPFLIGYIFCVINEHENVFNVTAPDLDWNNPVKYTYLTYRFAVFFYGTMAAILLILLESSEVTIKFIKKIQVQYMISFATYDLIYYTFRYRTEYFKPELAKQFNYESIPALILIGFDWHFHNSNDSQAPKLHNELFRREQISS